jgi:uncharacterized membrane protein
MPDKKQSGLSDNSLGAIAYITVVPALFFLAIAPYNKKAYVRFHAWQSTVLFAIVFIISAALSYIPIFSRLLGFIYGGLSALIWVIWGLISLLCAVNALNGKRIKLPLIGAWSEQQANK